MVVYSFDEWSLMGFQPASYPHKYLAIIRSNAAPDWVVRIPFGRRGYDQYHDQVFGLFANRDHLDPQRRAAYRARHARDRLDEFSPGYFSMRYLW